MTLDPDKVLVSQVPPGTTIVSSTVIHSTPREARIPAGLYVLDLQEYMNIAVLMVKDDLAGEIIHGQPTSGYERDKLGLCWD